MTTTVDKALLERQEELENEYARRGARRFERALRDRREAARKYEGVGESHTGAAAYLWSQTANPTAEVLLSQLEGAAKRGRPEAGLQYVKALSRGKKKAARIASEVVAEILFNRLSHVGSSKAGDTCVEIGRRIEREVVQRIMRREQPGAMKRLEAKWADRPRLERNKRAQVLTLARKRGVTLPHMSPKDRFHVGNYLLRAFMTATEGVTFPGHDEEPGVVLDYDSKSMRWSGSRRKYVKEGMLVLTDACWEYIHRTNAFLAFDRPERGPLVIPPHPWAPGTRGGYHFKLEGKVKFCRWRVGAPGHVYYSAINAAQRTAWAINAEVLDLIWEADGTEMGNALGIESPEVLPSVPRPSPNATQQEWKERNYKEALRIDYERERGRERGNFDRTIRRAEEHRDHAAIYFVYNADWRGRVFAVGDYLRPQGPSIQKALLRFAAGVALGDAGAAWLALHGSNMYNPPHLKKASLDARIEWINADDTQDMIWRVAMEPLDSGKGELLAADDPWRFYAFCREWVRLAEFVEDGGDDRAFLSTLPIQLDGSNNGTQHLAAAFGDIELARQANLIPSIEPSDMYGKLQDKVTDRLAENATARPKKGASLTCGSASLEEAMAFEADRVRAVKWMSRRDGDEEWITRKLIKKPAMTLVYGTGEYTYEEHLEAYFKDRGEWEEVKNTFDEPDKNRNTAAREACRHLAKVIYQVQEEEFPTLFKYRAWMQEVVQAVVDAGVVPAWRSPVTDFPVRQGVPKYYEQDIIRPKGKIDGRQFRPEIYVTRRDKLKRRQHVKGISPNVVHSWDSAHLCEAIVMAADVGVRAVGPVHDAFQVHAGNGDEMDDALRQAFTHMYSMHAPAVMLYQDLQALVPHVKLKEPPIQGSLEEMLDHDAILLADHAFA